MLRLLSFVLFAGFLLLLAGGGSPQEAEASNAQLNRIEVPPAIASTTALDSAPVFEALPSRPVALVLRRDRISPTHSEPVSLPDPLTAANVLRI
jgi:hypothetical protein